MVISKSRKFIFIHIPKNAGMSISAALLPFTVPAWQRRLAQIGKRVNVRLPFDPQPFTAHTPAGKVMAEIGREAYGQYFSFAFVRNPWERLTSLYKYIERTPGHYLYGRLQEAGSFPEFIRWRCSKAINNQKDFIFSAEGECLVNFIGRFERLEADFAEVCARLGIAAVLPRLNVSYARPYREFYDEEAREAVRKAYAADIALFGYDF